MLTVVALWALALTLHYARDAGHVWVRRSYVAIVTILALLASLRASV